MGKRADLEPRAIALYAEGMETPHISVELGVSENSLRDWKKRAGTEWDEARASFRKGALASMEDIGRRMQRVRGITDRISVDAKNQGRMGQLLNEGLQAMLFDAMGQVDPDDMEASIGHMKSIALILQRTEAAANLNLKREAEIRKQVIEQAAETVEKTAQQAGVSAETIQKIRRDVLMMAA